MKYMRYKQKVFFSPMQAYIQYSPRNTSFQVSYQALWPSASNQEVTLMMLDHSSGILQVWYLLLEGLAGATMTCPRRYQPQALDTLFTLLRSLPDCPGKFLSCKSSCNILIIALHDDQHFLCLLFDKVNRKYRSLSYRPYVWDVLCEPLVVATDAGMAKEIVYSSIQQLGFYCIIQTVHWIDIGPCCGVPLKIS